MIGTWAVGVADLRALRQLPTAQARHTLVPALRVPYRRRPWPERTFASERRPMPLRLPIASSRATGRRTPTFSPRTSSARLPSAETFWKVGGSNTRQRPRSTWSSRPRTKLRRRARSVGLLRRRAPTPLPWPSAPGGPGGGGPATAELWALYVHPRLRDRGAGRRLFSAAVAAADQRYPGSRRLVVLTFEANAPARRFYESFGGRLFGILQGYEMWGREYPVACYEWTPAAAIQLRP
ncbi:MAG: GNAT family N-acetyltransferase [Myxococcales bacterium]